MRSRGSRDLAIAMTGTFVVAVLGTRPFVTSWARTLGVGATASVALLALSLWSRRAEARELEAQYGRITLRGPVLTIEEPREEAVSIRATDMRELWYDYNPFGWSAANSWKLVYEAGHGRKETRVWESSGDHLLAPLRVWCVRHLPDFDHATFDRLACSPGDDAERDVLVWSRREM